MGFERETTTRKSTECVKTNEDDGKILPTGNKRLSVCFQFETNLAYIHPRDMHTLAAFPSSEEQIRTVLLKGVSRTANTQ